MVLAFLALSCLSYILTPSNHSGNTFLSHYISDAVAETIIDLGIDWSGLDTVPNLQTGLRVAVERLKDL